MILAALKETLGFVGTVLILVPWLRDYAGRLRIARIRGLRTTDSLNALRSEIVEHREHWLAQPKSSDLAITIGGLILIALTFAIGLWLAVSEPGGTTAGDPEAPSAHSPKMPAQGHPG